MMPATTPTSALSSGLYTQPLARRLTVAGVTLGCLALDGFAWLDQAPFNGSLLFANAALIIALFALAHVRQAPEGAIALRPEELAGHMSRAREGERERLGRDLHDEIGQLLTAARLQVDWLDRRLPAELAESVATLRATLADCLGTVRDMSTLLSPHQLASLGLELCLRNHLRKALAETDLDWSLDCRQRLDGLPADIQVAAFRIIQEGVTNLLRHARARNLWVEVAREKQGLWIRIADDGEGFDTAAVPPGRGLAGMAERTQALRGHLKVYSAPGEGTRVEALLPWPGRASRRAAKARS